MQTNDLTAERLRQLADLKPDNAQVLSLFLNLDPRGLATPPGPASGKAPALSLNRDPRDLATPPARASEVRSVLDQADKAVKEAAEVDGLGHEKIKALREDLDRARAFFDSGWDA